MKNILVTGSKGFVGKNLIVSLKQIDNYKIIEIDSSSSETDLKLAINDADFIVHLAGVNRPKEISEFYSGNNGLTKKIVDYLIESNKKTPILITSSIHAESNTDYGISKKKSEDILIEYSKKYESNIYIYRLPNLFGKWCKPNYNSAIATFCHNIANDLEVWIKDPDIELELVYIDDLINSILECIENDPIEYNNLIYSRKLNNNFYEVNTKYKKTLGSIVDSINMFKSMRETLILPDLSDGFNKALYSTYLTYLDKNKFSYNLIKNKDDRGWLAELIKSKSFGQIFISKTKPGITRGNHWHHTKTEKFLVVQGDAVVRFRRVDENDVIEYLVNGESPEVIDIPPGYTHSIENIGKDDVITLFWSNEIFDVENPDTYFLEVK